MVEKARKTARSCCLLIRKIVYSLGPMRLSITLLSLVSSTICLFSTAVAQEKDQPTITPEKVINLMADPEFKDFTVNLNPKSSLTFKREEVWKIMDDGLLHVSGKGLGYIRTNRKYRDYHLVLEYKWGERTWASRVDRARDCGLLVHAYGEDGAYGLSWINSIEAQLIEGGSGDILVLAAKDENGKIAPTRVTAKTEKDRDGETVWNKKGTSGVFPREGKTMARINWEYRDPDWKDVRGYRGSRDVERSFGQWNRMEVICRGDTIRILINGKLVNEVSQVSPPEGYICLQSELAQCLIRRYELYPLDSFHEKWKPRSGSTDMGYSITGESILPREAPLSPEDSLAAWQIDGHYEMQLAAAEPVVADPVDVAWDKNGRMFVAEMRDYPLPIEDGGPFLSRIRLLTDTDADGRMDKAVIWADDLDNLQGLLAMDGGILATTRTEILFLKDTDGDDVADLRTPLFHSNDPRHNQLQVSCPEWGLDNAIYLNNGLDGREIYPVGHPEAKTNFTRLNLRYDPYHKTIGTVSGAGQYGASQDDFGRRFFCSNRNPVMFAVMPLAAVRRNPLAGITKGSEDIQMPGAPVWPVALTHTTSAAHAGTHTAACGLCVYRGNLMPDLLGDIFVCDPTAQLVTRNHLVPHGASFTADRVGEKRDFLASGDEWCRPVHVRNGPDGALYICDMYRRFIDHARFFPEDFSKSHYMRAGVDQGRIWRLVPKGENAPVPHPLPKEPELLVHELESPIAWRRIHAQRLLVEKGDSSVTDSLKQLVAKSPSPTARTQAMWILQFFGQLSSEDVLRLFKDANPGVVENALTAAQRTFPELPEIRQAVSSLAVHPNRRVRFLSVALFPEADGKRNYAKMIRDNPEDPWIRRALMSSAGKKVGALLIDLLKDKSFLNKSAHGHPETLKEFASLTAANGDVGEISQVIASLKGEPAWWHYEVVLGLSEGLRKSPLKQKSIAALITNPPVELSANLGELGDLLDKAGELALNRKHPIADRIAALPLVAQQGFEKATSVVAKLLSPSESSEIQAAACQSLSRFNREQVADFFFKRWHQLPPTALREAVTLIVGSPKTGLELMKKMKAGEISKSFIPPITRWSYGRSKNEEIKSLAVELFGEASSDRAKLITEYRSALTKHKGDPEKGKAVFEKATCITCHKLGSTGVEVGPSLLDVRMKQPEALLTDILDPNRAVEERWISAVVETKDGRSLAGLVYGDNEASVTLRMPGGLTETIPRNEIKKFGSTGMSLMPVGLEAAITKSDMADLIAFLKAAR